MLLGITSPFLLITIPEQAIPTPAIILWFIFSYSGAGKAGRALPQFG